MAPFIAIVQPIRLVGTKMRIIRESDKDLSIEERVVAVQAAGDISYNENGCWIQKKSIRYSSSAEGDGYISDSGRYNPGGAKTFVYEFIYGIPNHTGFKFKGECKHGHKKCINPFHFILNLNDATKYKERNDILFKFFYDNTKDFDMQIEETKNTEDVTSENIEENTEDQTENTIEVVEENEKKYVCDYCKKEYTWNKSRYCSIECAFYVQMTNKTDEGCFLNSTIFEQPKIMHDEIYDAKDAAFIIKFGEKYDSKKHKDNFCKFGYEHCINPNHLIKFTDLEYVYIQIEGEKEQNFYKEKIKEMIIVKLCEKAISGKSNDELYNLLRKIDGLKRGTLLAHNKG